MWRGAKTGNNVMERTEYNLPGCITGTSRIYINMYILMVLRGYVKSNISLRKDNYTSLWQEIINLRRSCSRQYLASKLDKYASETVFRS